jgi:hypothetical protein
LSGVHFEPSILLLASTGLIALCAEFLVGSIEQLVENTPLSEAVIGLIILPIVGNAAEHVTAVTVAAKNKVDLALGVNTNCTICDSNRCDPGLDPGQRYVTLFQSLRNRHPVRVYLYCEFPGLGWTKQLP